MPRKAHVSFEELLSVVLAEKEILRENGYVVGPTHPIWKTISLKLQEKIQPRNVYTRVQADRNKLLSKWKDYYEIYNVSSTTTKYSSESSCKEDSNASSDADSKKEVIIKGKKTFKVVIPEWVHIKPIETQYKTQCNGKLRNIHTLPPYQWENVLVELLWDQHRFPCPYSFKKSRVSPDNSTRKQYIYIYGSVLHRMWSRS